MIIWLHYDRVLAAAMFEKADLQMIKVNVCDLGSYKAQQMHWNNHRQQVNCNKYHPLP